MKKIILSGLTFTALSLFSLSTNAQSLNEEKKNDDNLTKPKTTVNQTKATKTEKATTNVKSNNTVKTLDKTKAKIDDGVNNEDSKQPLERSIMEEGVKATKSSTKTTLPK